MATTKLFVGNITRGSESAQLRQEFERFGDVAECDIITDYGFVHFTDPAAADAALEQLHGQMFNGQKLKVEKSTSYVRRKAGDGDKGSETCYVCGQTGHWAKNCPDVPEHERVKQTRRAERGRGGGSRGGGRGGKRPRDRYDDYDDDDYYPPPPRRRRPPPDYYDDYDDYDLYYRRRAPPPRYYDPYDYDYDYPPRRRVPPPLPSYYRSAADPYPPSRRLPPLDDYPPPRALAHEYDRARGMPSEEYARATAAPVDPLSRHLTPNLPSTRPAGYYDFTDDNVDKIKVEREIDPLAGGERERFALDRVPSSGADRMPTNGAERVAVSGADRFTMAGADRLASGAGERMTSSVVERYTTSDRYPSNGASERYASSDRMSMMAADRAPMDAYRRASRPY